MAAAAAGHGAASSARALAGWLYRLDEPTGFPAAWTRYYCVRARLSRAPAGGAREGAAWSRPPVAAARLPGSARPDGPDRA